MGEDSTPMQSSFLRELSNASPGPEFLIGGTRSFFQMATRWEWLKQEMGGISSRAIQLIWCVQPAKDLWLTIAYDLKWYNKIKNVIFLPKKKVCALRCLLLRSWLSANEHAWESLLCNTTFRDYAEITSLSGDTVFQCRWKVLSSFSSVSSIVSKPHRRSSRASFSRRA